MSKISQHPAANKQQENDSITWNDKLNSTLYRLRFPLLISILVIVVGSIAYSVFYVVQTNQRQKSAASIYQLRKGYKDWKESYSASSPLLAISEEQRSAEDKQDIAAEETERESLLSSAAAMIQGGSEPEQAWAFWIEALVYKELADEAKETEALEKLSKLNDSVFMHMTKLRLANLYYSQKEADKALALWQELTAEQQANSSQILAAAMLGNYYARNGSREDSLRYWKMVIALSDELLSNNGLEDTSTLVGGDNIITGSFRNLTSTWKDIAKNQILFLESEAIKVPANSYDSSVALADSGASQAASPTSFQEALNEAGVGNFLGGDGASLPSSPETDNNN